MELPGRPQAVLSDRVRQASVTLRPGACTVFDWAANVPIDDNESAADENTGDSDEASDSGGSDDEEGGGGYTSGAAVPPAIANDPFFARLLRNAEMHEASEKKSARRRVAKDAAEDMYDLDDPFIDDAELTVLGGQSYNRARQQQRRKKRRKRDDGNNTEPDAAGASPAADGEAGEGGSGNKRESAGGEDHPLFTSLEDLDRYEEDDFFVYRGPLNEAAEDASGEDSFEAPKRRKRKRPEKKAQQPAAKEQAGHGKKKASSNGEAAMKKKPDTKAQNRRAGSDAPASLIPTNGRKAGPRASRKLDPNKAAGAISADDSKSKLPPIPERDKPPAPAAPANGAKRDRASSTAAAGGQGKGDNSGGKPQSKRGGTPAPGAVVSSTTATPDDSKAIAEARQPTADIEAALAELVQATKSEGFANRQRFPSSLKPSLRQVCELSMARALEYDRTILALGTPEHLLFAWTTPLDIVGFITGIYHRLAAILPYNRATVRKIVSKLLGPDLLTWKEQQLKQLEEGLKARIDDQIKNEMGWIPVAQRAAGGSKEGDEAAAAASGGSQVRWHWTTLSKHILFQYMVLTLNINELRNQLEQGAGKDGAYREQQARKDAYAHLVNLWPGSSMSTYEISRAYSSRKSLLEKQSKKNDSTVSQDSPSSAPASQPASVAISEGMDKAQTAAVASGPGASTAHDAPAAPASDATAIRFESPSAAVAVRQMSPYIQQEPAASPGGEHILQSPRFGPFTAQSSPSNQHSEAHPANLLSLPAYDGSGAAERFPSPTPALSHRALDFAAMNLPAAPADTRMHSHHGSPFFGGGEQQFQPVTPQQQPGDGSGGRDSPGSGRYSMSVKNLTTP
ncbi:hypothetical protein GGF46_000063 [Coemansia sp. RSA 552]|nr:hypothetical protein GGF46_000063 [Coemansia sp. RSA 552]